MTNDEFIAEFGHLAAAPAGIERLRQTILDLAVWGRLVPHDPSEEPAITLRELEPPHDVAGWGAVRLGDAVTVKNGAAFPSQYFNDDGRGMPLVRIRDVRRGYTETWYGGPYEPDYVVRAGGLLVGMDGRFDHAFWRGDEALLNQRVCRLDFVSPTLLPSFVHYVLGGFLQAIHNSASSVTVKHLSSKTIANIVLPLPPVAEQQRIVDRIDELMGLCDEIEERQVQAVKHRAATARSALAELVELDRADTDRALRLVEEHVRLCLAPGEGATEVLARVRQSILDLAVRGRLVDLDPRDEPPPALPGCDAGAGVGSFQIPTHWVWASLASLASYIQRGKGPAYADEGRVVVLSQKCVRDGYVDLGPARPIQDESIVSYKPERFLQVGDILWNSTGDGTVGRSAVFGSGLDHHPVVPDSHVTVIRLRDASTDFVRLWLAATWVQTEIVLGARGSTKQTELNLSVVKATPVPLPPRREQERIVARVGELMVLCDNIEAALMSERDFAGKLAASACAAVVATRDRPSP